MRQGKKPLPPPCRAASSQDRRQTSAPESRSLLLGGACGVSDFPAKGGRCSWLRPFGFCPMPPPREAAYLSLSPHPKKGESRSGDGLPEERKGRPSPPCRVGRRGLSIPLLKKKGKGPPRGRIAGGERGRLSPPCRVERREHPRGGGGFSSLHPRRRGKDRPEDGLPGEKGGGRPRPVGWRGENILGKERAFHPFTKKAGEPPRGRIAGVERRSRPRLVGWGGERALRRKGAPRSPKGIC